MEINSGILTVTWLHANEDTNIVLARPLGLTSGGAAALIGVFYVFIFICVLMICFAIFLIYVTRKEKRNRRVLDHVKVKIGETSATSATFFNFDEDHSDKGEDQEY